MSSNNKKRKPPASAMDNKRIKFSPSSILEIEQQAIACLVGLKTLQDNHMSIGWDLLFNLLLHLPPSFICICFKCTTVMNPQMEYYQYPYGRDKGSYPRYKLCPKCGPFLHGFCFCSWCSSF